MASRREFLKGSAGLAALSGCSTLMPLEAADTLIINGRIATLDPKQPNAEAIAIRGERIVAVGTDHQISSFKGPNTRVIDAGRRIVIPGLNDGHTHFIREMGIPLACGTDANRATSYNPWVGVHWLLTGKTLGGGKLQGDRNLLDRTEALRLYTAGGAWVSSEEGKKGTLEPGKLADLVVLSGDYFSMPVDEVKDLESLLTVVGGKVVYAAGPYSRLDPPPPPALPDWLPVRHYGGYHKKSASVALPPAAHRHPTILSESGNWSIECSCGGI